jgi:hypothetical protein
MKTTRQILSLFLFAALASSAFASGGYLYGLNANGIVSCNGNKIRSYPSDYDPGDAGGTAYSAWWTFNIIGGDQYALRADGNYYMNGTKLWKLPYNGWYWANLKHSNGNAYALRYDGALAVSNGIVANLPLADLQYFFSSLVVDGNTTYSLRSDGSVFKNAGSVPLFVFHAGPGLGGQEDGVGWSRWIALRLKPGTPYLYALRMDGVLYRGQIINGTNTGDRVDSLPFSLSDTSTYWDFQFDDVLNDWLVLRSNGMVYREGTPLQPVSDFDGDSFNSLAVFNGKFYALRGDGKVYVEGMTDPLLDLPGNNYGALQFGTMPPNLTSSKNNAPYVIQYTIPVNTNRPVRLPVIATDVETPTPDLIVTPSASPTGSVWIAEVREWTWTAPELKGNYTFSYIVDDTDGSAKTYKSKVQVKYPDLDPAKNKPPYLPKINKAMALVGQECRIYIPLGDPDNDPVTVTTDPTVFPFSAGATYDPVSSEFIWTPTVLDINKYTIPFTFTDGTNTKTFKLKLEVKSSLHIEPLP